MKKQKFLLPFFMLFLLTLLTFPVCAEDNAVLFAETVNRGTCGSGMSWRLDVDGVMTISGNGMMTDYPSANTVPWRKYRLDIWKVNIEYGVTHVGNYAFSDCAAMTALTIPESVDTIGDSAFANCEQLSDIVITSGVREIGNRAFTGCAAITGLTLPQSVISLGQAAFSYCTGLTEFHITGSLDETRPSLFANCTALETVTLPDTVRTIGQWTFSGCSALSEFTIPERVSTIAPYAFKDCASLQSVALTSRMTELDSGTFYNCSALQSVTIPDSVHVIKQAAFGGCYALRDVYYTGTASQWEAVSKNDFADMIERRFIDVHYGQAEPVSTATIESITVGNGRVTVHVAGSPDEGSTLFIAAYDADGRFLGVDSHPINDPNAYTVFAKEAHTLTVFLLDSRRRPAASAVSKAVPTET
ncbi:MAG: leucine-rich repeat domain-containing protein [Oscillospiraceae bacterium]|nr:leucine-rich repeat domain-containing protein [Oscillospiraceae bacterium]